MPNRHMSQAMVVGAWWHCRTTFLNVVYSQFRRCFNITIGLQLQHACCDLRNVFHSDCHSCQNLFFQIPGMKLGEKTRQVLFQNVHGDPFFFLEATLEIQSDEYFFFNVPFSTYFEMHSSRYLLEPNPRYTVTDIFSNPIRDTQQQVPFKFQS